MQREVCRMNRGQFKQYILETYPCEANHPWIKYPNNEVFRHPGNRKWFALVMDVPKNKLGLALSLIHIYRFPGIWRFSSLSLVEIRLMVSPDRYILKILSTMDASSGTISGSPSSPFRYPSRHL